MDCKLRIIYCSTFQFRCLFTLTEVWPNIAVLVWYSCRRFGASFRSHFTYHKEFFYPEYIYFHFISYQMYWLTEYPVGKVSFFSWLRIIRVTEVRSKILTPLETTGGNSFSLEGFEKRLFTFQNFTQGDLHSTGGIQMSFLGGYNSTGGIQLSFLGVYNSTGGIQISFLGV